MILDYNKLFWGDSVLEKIEIEYDNIKIYIFNDVEQKHIIIECEYCAGMTEIITWDEIIIENVYLNEIKNEQHPLIASVKEQYGKLDYYEPNKSVYGSYFELRVLLISNLSFSVICKQVTFKDNEESNLTELQRAVENFDQLQ